jgi:hypothetical protein
MKKQKLQGIGEPKETTGMSNKRSYTTVMRNALCSCRQECLRFFPRAWKYCGQKPKLNQDEPANANSNANANANVLVDEICFVSQRFIEEFNMTENRTSKQGTG